jgi:catechol-2,3-dioxygenase
MSRLQLALNVGDLEAAVEFYSKLFATEPTKRRPGYANFAIAEPPLKLVLMENPNAIGRLNHLGIEVESSEQVAMTSHRLQQTDLSVTPQTQSTCCYALQDKVWLTDPDGAGWEVYTVLEDSATFGQPQQTPSAACCA